MRTFKELLTYLNLMEDRFSPTRKHAVFIVGGPGSGKSFFSKNLEGLGLTIIDPDIGFEHLMKKSGQSLNLLTGTSDEIDRLREQAKRTTFEKMRLASDNGNGLIIGATGQKLKSIQERNEYLRQKGYKTHLLFIHTSNEVSKRRNELRGEMGGRSIPEEVREKAWRSTQQNKEQFNTMFGDGYKEFDNDKTPSSDEEKRIFQTELFSLFKHYKKKLENTEMNESFENEYNKEKEFKDKNSKKDQFDHYPEKKSHKTWEYHTIHKNEYYDILDWL